MHVRGSRGAPESARCRRRYHSCRARRRGWMGAERSTRKTGHVRRAPRRRVGRHRWTFRDRLAQFLAAAALATGASPGTQREALLHRAETEGFGLRAEIREVEPVLDLEHGLAGVDEGNGLSALAVLEA